MTMKRITISVPEEIAEKARRAASSGYAESVSAYFAGLAAREPDWAAAEQIVDAMISETGGLSDEAQAWARSVVDADDAGAAGAA